MNTCGPATQLKKLPITHLFEALMWAWLYINGMINGMWYDFFCENFCRILHNYLEE